MFGLLSEGGDLDRHASRRESHLVFCLGHTVSYGWRFCDLRHYLARCCGSQCFFDSDIQLRTMTNGFWLRRCSRTSYEYSAHVYDGGIVTLGRGLWSSWVQLVRLFLFHTYMHRVASGVFCFPRIITRRPLKATTFSDRKETPLHPTCTATIHHRHRLPHHISILFIFAIRLCEMYLCASIGEVCCCLELVSVVCYYLLLLCIFGGGPCMHISLSITISSFLLFALLVGVAHGYVDGYRA